MSATHADRAIARHILSGDARAFRELFDSYFPRLYRFALARLDGNRDMAREVVQLTFCKGFERLDSYRGESALYAWFCQICRNAIFDLGRSRQRELQHVPLLDTDMTIQDLLEAMSAPESDEPDSHVWRDQMMGLIQAALDCLPGRYGDVLEWKYLDGLSVQEIGMRLAIGQKAAESCLTRARSAFREAIAAIHGSVDLPHG